MAMLVYQRVIRNFSRNSRKKSAEILHGWPALHAARADALLGRRYRSLVPPGVAGRFLAKMWFDQDIPGQIVQFGRKKTSCKSWRMRKKTWWFRPFRQDKLGNSPIKMAAHQINHSIS